MRYNNKIIAFIAGIIFYCLSCSLANGVIEKQTSVISEADEKIISKILSFAGENSAAEILSSISEGSVPMITPDSVKSFFAQIPSNNTNLQDNLLYLCQPLLQEPAGTVLSSFGFFEPKPSELYKGFLGIKNFPMLHPYNVDLDKYPTILVVEPLLKHIFLPPCVKDLDGEITAVKIVVMSLPWSQPVLYRPHYMIHSKNNDQTTLSVAITECDFGDAHFKDSKTSKTYISFSFFTHYNNNKEKMLVASPDNAEIVFSNKDENIINSMDIKSGSFWIIHKQENKKTATFFWILNDPVLNAGLRSLVSIPDQTLLGLLGRIKNKKQWGNPVKRLHKMFGLSISKSRYSKKMSRVKKSAGTSDQSHDDGALNATALD